MSEIAATSRLERRSPASLIAREAARQRLRALCQPAAARLQSVLTPREQMILFLRLGVVSDVPVTQTQIARRLDCSPGHVATLEKHARQKVAALFNLEE
jgi:DNA-directed RNA polymerase sigma subunit (sigma70/sigma32)